MKKVLILLFSVFFVPQVTEKDPLTILQEARKMIQENEYVKYRQQAFYPNPMGLVDTMNAVIELKKAPSTALGYDFKFSQANREEIKIKDDMKIINHTAEKVVFFRDENELIEYVAGHRYLIFSPVTLLKENWGFVSKNKAELNFSFTETDTVVDGNTLRTEYHIFLNEESKLIHRFERRNFYKGDLSQTVIYKYSEYEINNGSNIQPLKLSSTYISEPFNNATSKVLLKKGSPAVEFKAEEISGKLLDLSNYKKKKVLLVFSAVNCGASLLALEFLKSENFQLDNNVSIIYIKPEDRGNELRQFIEINSIPFPVIPNAKEIREKYGVSAYPTFFLLNGNHIIQEVKVGFDRDFLNNLKKI